LPTLRRHRERAAYALVHEAELLHQLECELLDRLTLLQQSPEDVLVLGAGGTRTVRWMLQRWPSVRLTVHDFCPTLLQEHAATLTESERGQVSWQCGERDQLASADASFDFIFSNLYLPWTDQADLVLREIWRVLRARGGVHFSTLGPDTFRELDRAWAHDSSGHVAQFPDMHDVGDALVHAGFKEPVMDRDALTLTYSTLAPLWRDLRQHGLEWVIGQAWKDPRLRQQQQADGSIAVPLARIYE